MYLRYGNYTHAANEASVAISRNTLFNDGGQPYAIVESWAIQGRILGDTQTAIAANLADLKAAYSVHGGDLAILHNDQSVSNHVLPNATSITGVRIVRGPEFPESRGAEYATYRTYNITLEAEYALPDVLLMAFTETLSFEGGGSLYTHMQLLNGLPQKQLLYENIPYRVTQQGSATGYFAYPPPMAPIWPGSLRTSPRITRTNPRRRGQGYTDYEVSWMYEFEDALPMVGIPNRWL